MADSELIKDIEGVLSVETVNNSQSYFKRLSLDTAWNTDEFSDLTVPENTSVREVLESFENKILTIKYIEGIELCGYGSIRKAISADKKYGLWRFLVFAEQICNELQTYHEHDLFQLVIHPARIAIHKERFIILPTLAGVLPKIPDLLMGQNKEWLYFMAPEIIRKRGLNISELGAGDIYSIGRLFKLILSKLHKLPEVMNPTMLCTDLVEHRVYKLNESLIPLPDDLQLLINAMCELEPSMRPDLPGIIEKLKNLALDHIPSLVISEHIEKKDYHIAEEEFKAYDKNRGLASFHDLHAELLYCDLEIMKKPPGFQKAINHIDKTIGRNPENYETYLKKGELYAAFTTHKQHAMLSVDAYQHACMLSKWKPEIQEKFLNATIKLEDLNTIISTSSTIPYNKRIPKIYLIWAMSHLRFEHIEQAWTDIIRY
ncbi:MAG: hypothetical protein DRJ13_07630, partial [Bacteroidetes bacterium]